MQAANNAHLQQITVAEKVVPDNSNRMTHQEMVGVTGVSKQNISTKGRPDAAQATECNSASEPREPGVTCLP